MGYTFWQSLVLSLLCMGFAIAAPGGAGFIAVGGVKPPITFDGGNVGVNFGGYHASAGLGGLLGGGAAGGLHAEAGTPFGQNAAAGLRGVVAEGETAGGLYAAADSGAGANAGAAIGGAKTVSGSFGGSISGAKGGGAYVSKTVEYQAPPVVVEKTVHAAPEVQKTYVERTVIPNYVEKTIQVPSYVEKTVRVPTVIEKKVRVPAAPTIIEKTISAPPENAHVELSGGIAAGGGTGQTVTVVEKTRPTFYKHWSVRKPAYGGFYAGGFGGAGGGSYGSDYDYGGGGSSVYTVRKSVSPQLFDNIFNIPISTLGAVSKLVGGLAGGTSGGVYVSKSVSAY